MDHAARLFACQAAAATLVTYDWVITLDWEIDLVWARRWTPAKVLFLFNRHFGPLYLVAEFAAMFLIPQWSDRLCQMWLQIKVFCIGIVVWAWLLQFTLLYRTFAMYSKVRHVKLILIGGYVLGVGVTFIMFPVLLLSFKAEPPDLRTSSTCYFAFVHPSLATFWLPGFLYELIFIILSVRITIKHVQYTTLLYGNRTATWARFIQDSLLYFIITSSMLFGNALAWVFLPPGWHLVLIGFSIVAICAAGNRLIFRLIQIYHIQAENDPDDTVLMTVLQPSRARSGEVPYSLASQEQN